MFYIQWTSLICVVEFDNIGVLCVYARSGSSYVILIKELKPHGINLSTSQQYSENFKIRI